MLSGNTLEINLKGISHNVKQIIADYSDYKYYIGVVKANAYGCGYEKVIKTMESSGINFFAVSNIDEALKVRKYTRKGILILTPVFPEDINKCIRNNISITIDDINYLRAIKNTHRLKIHIKLNTGMNRFGSSNFKEINEMINYSKKHGIKIEGIYTHIYYASNKKIVDNQIDAFNYIFDKLNYEFPMVHIMNSESLLYYDKFKYTNGIRIGDLLYGLTLDERFESVISLKSHIIKVRKLKKGDTVGYDGAYTAEKDNELIGIIPIGYADGLLKPNKGRYVYINDKKYKIIGNICMCNTFIKIDENVKLYDTVYVIKDSKDVMRINEYINDTYTESPSEITCLINDNIKKEYI